MNVNVKKLTKEQSVLEVFKGNQKFDLTIDKTQLGHSYDDFSDWPITDSEYYDLEEFVDSIIKQMEGKNHSECNL